MAIAIKRPPISLYFHSENTPAHRPFYCPFCAQRLFDQSGRLVMIVDNSGPSHEFYLEVKCRNSQCQQTYRVFMPPSETVFEPVVMVNGVPLPLM